ncbi:MAG: ABC transporter ATP-binding protein [Clostridiales bacterium]
MNILKAKSIEKKYFKKIALDNINLEIEEGKIIGILGPNGSGKTTFLKLIAGLLRPSNGFINVCGINISYKTKELISYLPDSDFLYQWMKISDAQKVYDSFFSDFNNQKFEDLLNFMKLEKNLSVKSLSRGMKEKLALCLTLSREAKLFILDEPLNGVDPVAREEILGAISKGFDTSSSMIVTSHMVNEIERLLDEVYFLSKGKIELSGDIETLREKNNMSLDDLYREVFAC